MPIYEYECCGCYSHKDVYKSMNDTSEELCHCGSPMVKLISASNFHLKGSGWYVTDYKNKNKQKKAKQE